MSKHIEFHRKLHLLIQIVTTWEVYVFIHIKYSTNKWSAKKNNIPKHIAVNYKNELYSGFLYYIGIKTEKICFEIISQHVSDISKHE